MVLDGSFPGRGRRVFQLIDVSQVRIGTDIVEKTLSLDQLHGKEPLVTLRKQLVQPHETRMGQIGERSKFMFESIEGRPIEAQHGLERD